MYSNLAVLAIFVFVYCVVAGRVERKPISGPIVFVLFGLVCGPVGLGLLRLDLTADGLRLAAELALAVVLFTDAARIRFTDLEHSRQIPTRLLLVGLPLTIVFGTLAGRLVFPALPWLELAILATMLAPTDAALGSSVVTNPVVPGEIREGLNVESGLNDGICVPIVMLLLVVESQGGTLTGSASLALRLVVTEIGIGLVCGLALAGLGWWLVARCSGSVWISDSWRQIAGLGLLIGGLFNLNKNNLIKTHLVRTDGNNSALADFAYSDFDMAYDASTGNVNNLSTIGGQIGLEHKWSSSLTSAFGVGFLDMDNEDYQGNDAFDHGYKALANIFFRPGDWLQGLVLAAEAEYATQTTKDGSDGETTRFSILAYYDW